MSGDIWNVLQTREEAMRWGLSRQFDFSILKQVWSGKHRRWSTIKRDDIKLQLNLF